METNTAPQTSVLPDVGVPLFGLNRTKEQEVPQNVYESLRNHQQGAAEKLRLLHTYLPLIINRFYGGSLPLPALSYGPSHWRALAWYMEKDGLALEHRINLNNLHADCPLAEILRSLAHELCHCWQKVHGHPPKPSPLRDDNYHNAEFRRKMQEVGIPCNKRGVSLGMEEPFLGFLKGLGIEADIFPFKRDSQPPPEGSNGHGSRSGSRLKPWACKCPKAKVWASIKVELDATCHRCGSSFQRQ